MIDLCMFVVFRAESPVQSAHIRIYGQRAPGREPSAESTPVYILWAESPGQRALLQRAHLHYIYSVRVRAKLSIPSF